MTCTLDREGNRYIMRCARKRYSEEVRRRAEEVISSLDITASNDTKILEAARKVAAGMEKEILEYIRDNVLGLGPLAPLMSVPEVEDISVVSFREPVFVYHRDLGYIPTDITFQSEVELAEFIKSIVERSGKQISISDPVVDVSLPDGSRLQATLGTSVTSEGPSLAIRKFRKDPVTPLDIIRQEGASSDLMAYLWLLVSRGANILVCGGTGTGKTTFLNALMSFIPENLRVITIEETREIEYPGENVLPLVTRQGIGRDTEVDAYSLLSIALRHRPNYIVLGEVRGEEAFSLFQAMSAGRYVMATFHAGSISTVVHRLEARPLSIPRNMLTALHCIVLLSSELGHGGTRRFVSSVYEVMGLDRDTGELLVNRAFSRENGTYSFSRASYALRRLADATGTTEPELMADMKRRSQFLSSLQAGNMREFMAKVSSFL